MSYARPLLRTPGEHVLAVIAQAPLLPAQLFGDPFGGGVESGMGVVVFAVTLRQYATSHMYRNIGANLFALPRFGEHHAPFDGTIEILFDGFDEPGLRVNAESFTDGNLFSGYRYLHKT